MTDEQLGVLARFVQYAWDCADPICTLPTGVGSLGVVIARSGVRASADSHVVRSVLALWRQHATADRVELPALREAFERHERDAAQVREKMAKAGRASAAARREMRDAANRALSLLPGTRVQQQLNSSSADPGPPHTPSVFTPHSEHKLSLRALNTPSCVQNTTRREEKPALVRIDSAAALAVERAGQQAAAEWERRWIRDRLTLARWPWGVEEDSRQAKRWMIDAASIARHVTPKLLAFVLACVDQEKPDAPAGYVVRGLAIGKRRRKPPFVVPELTFGVHFDANWAETEMPLLRVHVTQARNKAIRAMQTTPDVGAVSYGA